MSTGISIDVQPVPPFALAEIERRHPLPTTTEAAELAPAQAAREREAAWLLALPGVTVPDDWQFPRGLRYAGIQPREGDEGRLLDYIEFGLLVVPSDIQAVQTVRWLIRCWCDSGVFPDNLKSELPAFRCLWSDRRGRAA